EHISSVHVGAEPELRRWRAQAHSWADRLGIAGSYPWSRDRHEHDPEQERGADHHGRIASDEGAKVAKSHATFGCYNHRQRHASHAASCDAGVVPEYGPCMSAGPSVANAGVDEGIGQVDQQVYKDVNAAEYEDDPLNDGIVTRENRIDGQPADAGNAEHALGDHHAADQKCKPDPDHGDDRHTSILQGMTDEHAVGRETFSVSSTNVVFGEHFQHRRSGDARE